MVLLRVILVQIFFIDGYNIIIVIVIRKEYKPGKFSNSTSKSDFFVWLGLSLYLSIRF